jgi:hypothetical protein
MGRQFKMMSGGFVSMGSAPSQCHTIHPRELVSQKARLEIRLTSL